MLEMRPNCACCDRDLPADADDAMICTFECSYCNTCCETKLNGICPNCGGNLEKRPIRPTEYWKQNPASQVRGLDKLEA